MKTFMIAILLMTSLTSFAATTSSTATMTVYQVIAFKNADCTDGTIVFNNSAGKTVNMISNPNIGGGAISDGTYNCIALTVQNSLIVTPTDNVEAPGCVQNTPVTMQICNGSTELINNGSTTSSGSVNCTNTSQKVTLYVSTNSVISDPNTDVNNCVGNGDYNAFKFPTAAAGVPACKGISMSGGPLDIKNGDSGIFFFDVNTRGMYNNAGSCEMNTPIIGFRAE